MPQHQALDPQFRLLVFLVSIGFFMQALDTTIVNTALPNMAQNLHADPLKMHNIVVAYVLSVALCIPLSGWFADRFGLRNTYLFAIVMFSLASLGCALAQSLHELIVYRVLQGIGGAFLLPIGRLAMLKIIPRHQFLSAMSLMSLAGLMGPLIGPSLGGWLVEVASWHWIFLINLPMGLLGVFICFKAMPNLLEKQVLTFDFIGFILLAVAMVGLCLGIERFAHSENHMHINITLLVMGLVASGLYAYHAHHQQNALFRSQLFRNQLFSIGILGNFFARFGGNAIPFILPLMLQVALGFDPLITGLLMIPTVLGSVASKPLVRPLIQAFGYRRVLLSNTLILGVCIASLAYSHADTSVWLRGLHFFVFGLLNSIQFVSMNTLTLKDLSNHDASSGNSFLSMVMMLSMSIGVALAGTLINIFSTYLGTPSMLEAFQWSLICLGAFNLIAAAIFWHIPKETSV